MNPAPIIHKLEKLINPGLTFSYPITGPMFNAKAMAFESSLSIHLPYLVVIPKSQWEFQDPKMEVMYHIRPYFAGIFPYIGIIQALYMVGTSNLGSCCMAIEKIIKNIQTVFPGR
jgi:hypothetical protein